LKGYHKVFSTDSGPGFNTLPIVLEYRVCQGNKLVQGEDLVGQIRIDFCHLDGAKEEGVSGEMARKKNTEREN